MMPMPLESQSISQTDLLTWQHIGALHLPNIAGSHLDAIRSEFNEFIERGDLKENQRSFYNNGYAKSRQFKKFMADSGLNTWLNDLLGSSLTAIAGDASIYAGDTNWHADVRDGTLPMVKLALYLTPERPNSFSFSYVPGSHHIAVAGKEKMSVVMANDFTSGRLRYPHFSVSAGDVVVFSPRLLHAVYDAGTRHQIAALYTAPAQTQEQSDEIGRMTLANLSVI